MTRITRTTALTKSTMMRTQRKKLPPKQLRQQASANRSRWFKKWTCAVAARSFKRTPARLAACVWWCDVLDEFSAAKRLYRFPCSRPCILKLSEAFGFLVW